MKALRPPLASEVFTNPVYWEPSQRDPSCPVDTVDFADKENLQSFVAERMGALRPNFVVEPVPVGEVLPVISRNESALLRVVVDSMSYHIRDTIHLFNDFEEYDKSTFNVVAREMVANHLFTGQTAHTLTGEGFLVKLLSRRVAYGVAAINRGKIAFIDSRVRDGEPPHIWFSKPVEVGQVQRKHFGRRVRVSLAEVIKNPA